MSRRGQAESTGAEHSISGEQAGRAPTGSATTGSAIAFVLKGYPRLSETFIAQEILGLQQRGLDIRLVSLRHPTDRETHPVHREITAPVSYLPEYLHDDIGRVWRNWRRARRLPGYPAAYAAWRRDLRRDRSRNRVRRFGQALVLAGELTPDVGHIHAHFLHTPASVARYASLVTGLPWTCSAHAKDVWTTPGWEIAEKLDDLHWLTTCTEAGRAHLAGFAAEPGKLHLVYHGLDFARFPAPKRAPRNEHGRDGGDEAAPVILLSVGRLVPKKGFDLLLGALARSAHLHWRWIHIGGGDRQPLEARAQALGIGPRIEWRGAQAQAAVLDALRAADLFILPSRTAADGDQDGLPNVLMEAQSQNLACLSTTVSGIPELIGDGETGVLVPPDDADALANALQTLIGDPALRARLGAAGFARVRERFGHDAGLERLAAMFGIEAATPVQKKNETMRVAAAGS